MVALSHYCCRTTLQCQCHVSQAKEQSQYLSAIVQLCMYICMYVYVRILVPSDVIGAIIGRKGQTIRSITEQTKARYEPTQLYRAAQKVRCWF